MSKSLLKETKRITSLLFRQNRIKIIIWMLCLVGITIATAFSYGEMYLTEKDIFGFAATMDNPAMKAMFGPGYPIEAYNIGTIFAGEMLMFSSIAIIIMNILLVSSSTRNDEEEGRLEMIRALPTGRLSYLFSSGIVVVIVNIIIGLLISVGLGLVGHSGMTWEASFLYGTLLCSVGLFFASLTSVASQMAETSRGASSIAFGVLIVSYIIRALGDINMETLSYFSPIGWLVRSDVFVGNQWWPIIALLIGTAVFVFVALYLNIKRDINVGLLPARKGKAKASAFLKTTIGLIWRLERITLLCWMIGLFITSLVFGSVLGEFETYFSDFELLKAIMPDFTSELMMEQFIVLLIGILSIATGIPGISTILKLRKEEKRERTENIYSRAVSRNKVLGWYLVTALLTTVIIQILIGLGLFLASMGMMEQGVDFGSTMSAALVYIPALWMIIGLTTLLVGAKPRFTGVAWGYIGFVFINLYLSEILKFPKWLRGLSVFYYIPQVPVEEIKWLPLLILLMIACVFSTAGFIGYNKRDLR